METFEHKLAGYYLVEISGQQYLGHIWPEFGPRRITIPNALLLSIHSQIKGTMEQKAFLVSKIGSRFLTNTN